MLITGSGCPTFLDGLVPPSVGGDAQGRWVWLSGRCRFVASLASPPGPSRTRALAVGCEPGGGAGGVVDQEQCAALLDVPGVGMAHWDRKRGE